MQRLTKFIKKSINIYYIKNVYENIFYNISNDANLMFDLGQI
jgi:hypothetical protein